MPACTNWRENRSSFKIGCNYRVQMYVNRKIRPVKTIPGMEGRRIKDNDWGGEFKYNMFGIL
jgi:hypothetical protein